jgi:hypothetical protein
MTNLRLSPCVSVLASLSVSLSVALCLAGSLAGCASGDDAPLPDAAPPRPLDVTGTYTMHTSYSLAAPPAVAATVLAELAAATDGPDDPARFLIDKLVARLPEGRSQLIAAAVAPYLAAYVQTHIDEVAPQLAAGVRSLADGLNRVARHWGTTEQWTIGHDSRVHRLITGLRFDVPEPVDVTLAPLGVADIAADANIAVAGERLTIGEHSGEVPFGVVLRTGLERGVVPRVVPGATTVAEALAMLVDCERLGVLVADYLSIGDPALYASACELAMTRVASELYERLDVANARMTLVGHAVMIDEEGDGPVDAIASGSWSGVIGNADLALSIFEGSRR